MIYTAIMKNLAIAITKSVWPNKKFYIRNTSKFDYL